MTRYKFLINLFFFIILSGCTSNKYTFIESENFDSRVKYLVIHFTSENLQDSIQLLTKKTNYPVSSHYLIGENAKTYKLVNETNRAWHAGASYWQGERGLNDSSIGIEIVNDSGCNVPIYKPDNIIDLSQNCKFLEYPKNQIKQVIKLSKEIISRHPRIKPYNVVAHSDIAPTRKIDPGPLFPWRELAAAGVGAWYDSEDYNAYLSIFKNELPDLVVLQKDLKRFGYDIEISGVNDFQSITAVRAFQLHFRPSKYDGYFDAETTSALYALLKKYNL